MPDAPLGSPPGLRFLRDDLISDAIWMALLVAIATAIVIVAFDWDLGPTLLSALAGGLALGTVNYLTDVRKRLPSQRVPKPPEDAFIQRRLIADDMRRALLMSVIVVPILLGLIWLLDLDDSDGFALPGVFLGHVFASFAGAIVAYQWESKHGLRLLEAVDDEGERTLYADSPGARPDLLAVGRIPPSGPIHPS